MRRFADEVLELDGKRLAVEVLELGGKRPELSLRMRFAIMEQYRRNTGGERLGRLSTVLDYFKKRMKRERRELGTGGTQVAVRE